MRAGPARTSTRLVTTAPDGQLPEAVNEQIFRQDAEISCYNQTNRGVPRDTKIRYVLDAMLDRPEAQAQVAARYAALLQQRLPDCVPLAGATTFLREAATFRYVASSAPVAEIHAQLDRRKIRDLFAGVFGYPHTKTEALLGITARHPGAVRAFFGDAPADRDAAETTETRFVAINPNPALAAITKNYFHNVRDTTAILAAATQPAGPPPSDITTAGPGA